jgi:hypothetical protein
MYALQGKYFHAPSREREQLHKDYMACIGRRQCLRSAAQLSTKRWLSLDRMRELSSLPKTQHSPEAHQQENIIPQSITVQRGYGVLVEVFATA